MPEQHLSRQWSRKKRAAIKLSLVVCGVLVGLAVAEIALRLAGYSYPVFYTTDPVRGYALRAHAEGWYRKENRVYIRINGAAQRDREHARSKPDGSYRIAVIGDSYAEALQVPLESAFWSVMERRAQACGEFAGREIEVINFGVSGYGTAQELLTLRRHVWDYSPDLVLLAVTTNNDITDNSRALKRTDEIPYFVRREGRLALDDSFLRTRAFQLRQSALNRAGRWIRDNLRVIQAVHEGHGQIKAAIAARRARGPSAPAAAPPPAKAEGAATAAVDIGGDIGIDNMIYREPSDGVWEEAWLVTEDLIVLMRDEVEAGGAKFLVVTLSNGGQVHPRPDAREDFARRVAATDLFYPDLRVRKLGEREGFTVLNLAPALQAYAERDGIFLHGFGSDLGNGHWNEAGHQAAGELLAEHLCAGAAN